MAEISSFLDRIICGDSLAVMKDMPDECVDLVITSPPYFGCRKYGNETLGREEDPREYLRDLFAFTSVIKRILKSTGSFYLNIGDVYFGTKGFIRNKGKWARKTDHNYAEHKIVKPDGQYLQYKQLLQLPSRLAIMMQDDGWILRNDIIWEKGNAIPAHSPDRRLPVYEHIYHFVKSRKYFFDYEKAKSFGHHRDVIKQNIEAYGDHQATFPSDLVAPFILTTSNEGDVVLDPFTGSGTVAAVAKNHNRRYVGIELLPQNCELANKRVSEVVAPILS